MAVYFIIAAVLPFLVLIYSSLLPYYQTPSIEAFKSMNFDTFRHLFELPVAMNAVKNSIVLGIATATVVMILTAIAAWGVVKTKVPGRQLLDGLTMTPLVIPGLVLGLALIFVYLRVPLAIYGTIWIMLISFATSQLPYGMRFSIAAMGQVGDELEESALVSGASRATAFRRITVPLMSAGLFAGWVFILIHTLRSLGTVILLYSPGNEVLAVLIFNAVQNGNYTEVAALGVLIMSILLILVAVSYKIGLRFGLKND